MRTDRLVTEPNGCPEQRCGLIGSFAAVATFQELQKRKILSIVGMIHFIIGGLS